MKPNPKTDLDLLREKSAAIVGDLLTDIALAHVSNDREKENEASLKLSQILRRTNGIANLLGRRRTLQQVETLDKKQNFDEKKKKNITPSSFTLDTAFTVPFHEAAEAIIDHQAFQNLEKYKVESIQRETEKMFGENAIMMGFGYLKAKNEAIYKANEILRKNISFGTPTRQAVQEIKKEMQDWSKATGETIYRTQVAKAYSAGQWRQLEDPVVRTRVGAVRFEATDDSDVRPMHLAWNGFLATPYDRLWEWMTPPIHYNCRCALLLVSRDTLEEDGELDNFGRLKLRQHPPIPIPNFGRKPNKTAYEKG